MAKALALRQHEALDDFGHGVLVTRPRANVVALGLHVLNGVGHAGPEARERLRRRKAHVEAGPLAGVAPGLTMAALGMNYLPES